jgi:hypothetical protein
MEQKYQRVEDGLVSVAHFMMIVILVLLLIPVKMFFAVLPVKSKVTRITSLCRRKG